jgi:hypothetical protein
MKNTHFQSLELLAGLLALPGLALGDPELETRAWRADNGQDAALVSSFEAGGAFTEAGHAYAGYGEGTFNPGGDVEKVQMGHVLITRAWDQLELGGGYRFLLFDTELQPDWVWSYPEEEQERNADAHGPALHARWSQPLGRSGWRLTTAATWMVYDLGGFEDLGYDGSHVEVEAGLAWAQPRWSAGTGYRWIRFADLPPRRENERAYDRNQLDGLYGTVTFRF